jgi:hypothetical protein
MTAESNDSPASRALDEAIDLDLEGRSPYPERSWFINDDTPSVDDQIGGSTKAQTIGAVN